MSGKQIARMALGALIGLVASAAVAYGLVLYNIALGFDGPGKLEAPEAAQHVLQAILLAVGGLGAGFGLAWLVARKALAVVVAMVPGAVLSAFLLGMVVREAISKV